MKIKRLFFHAFFVCLAVFITSGCGRITPNTNENIRKGGDLVFGIMAHFSDYNPFAEKDIARSLTKGIYETLVCFLPGREGPQPMLAENWQISEDRLEYDFKLREDVLFHDKSTLDADAAVKSLERLRAGNTIITFSDGTEKTFFSNIRKISANSDFSIKITLFRPDPFFIFSMADLSAGIVKVPTASPSGNTNENIFPFGTGPFFVSGVTAPLSDGTGLDEGFVYLDRFENYHGKAPYLDRIVFRFIPDRMAGYLALKAGDIDILKADGFPVIDKIRENRKLRSFSGFDGRVYYISFNMKEGPAEKKEFRKAFSHLLDRSVISAELFKNLPVLPAAVSPYIYRFAWPGGEKIPYDPDAARIMLDETGAGETAALTVLGADRGGAAASGGELGAILDRYLNEAGIDTEMLEGNTENTGRGAIISIFKGEASGRQNNGVKTDLFAGGWFNAGCNPFFISDVVFGEAIESDKAFSDGFSRDEYSALLYNALNSWDDEVSGSFYSQAADYISDFTPWLAIAWSAEIYAAGRNVMGINQRSDATIDLSELWIRK